jgi:hypothetical protein
MYNQGTYLRHREPQLVEFVNAHFHGADTAVGERDFKQDEGPEDAGAGGGGDADADAPSHTVEARLGDFVAAAEEGEAGEINAGWIRGRDVMFCERELDQEWK